MSESKKLVVALHDVAPPFETEIRAQLDALAGIGIRRCVLLVVPNWQGKARVVDSPSFTALLREQVALGSEIVLHGLEHWTRGPLSGTPWNLLRAGVFAPGSGEFLSLSGEEAYQAIGDGLDLLAVAGLPRPSGFCAPGWLLNEVARRALRRAGVRYVANMFSLDDLPAGKRRWVPSMGYMGGGPRHEVGIAVLNSLVRAGCGSAGALQVYLHPKEGTGGRAVQRVLALAGRLVRSEGRTPVTYEDLLCHLCLS